MKRIAEERRREKAEEKRLKYILFYLFSCLINYSVKALLRISTQSDKCE
jgi:hypothetical protein